MKYADQGDDKQSEQVLTTGNNFKRQFKGKCQNCVKYGLSESRFHKFDWEDFYREAVEPIPNDVPVSRG